jgi:ribose 5-phosphate isomerase A
MLDALSLKKLVAQTALQWVKADTIIGIGTGSTVDCFIDALGQSGIKLSAAVSSSLRTEIKLKSIGIPVIDLNEVTSLAIYIDGADEIDPNAHLIKGGGGALTREKIVAEAAQQFICIADASKEVDILGQFPLPIEVLPIARALVEKKAIKLGAKPELRKNFLTDNGNIILDLHHLKISNPVVLEQEINQWPGVVCCGLFARRKADIICISDSSGVRARSA